MAEINNVTTWIMELLDTGVLVEDEALRFAAYLGMRDVYSVDHLREFLREWRENQQDDAA